VTNETIKKLIRNIKILHSVTQKTENCRTHPLYVKKEEV